MRSRQQSIVTPIIQQLLSGPNWGVDALWGISESERAFEEQRPA